MKCPICGKEVELKNRQVGTDENGEPVFNEYAVCRDCKKQWNLDRQRAKKEAAKKEAAAAAVRKDEPKREAPEAEAAKKPAPEKEKPVKRPAEKRPAEKRPAEKKAGEKAPAAKKRSSSENTAESAAKKPVPRKRPAAGEEGGAPADEKAGKTSADRAKTARRKSPDGNARSGKPASDTEGNSAAKRPVKKRRTENPAAKEDSEQRYGNIPPEKVRTKKEKAVRRGYEDMVSTDPRSKSSEKKAKEEPSDEKEEVKAASVKHSENEKTAAKAPEPEIEDSADYAEGAPRFRAFRIVLGVISLVGFGFFIYKGFVNGLESISSGSGTTGTTYIILALCFLVSAMLYFIMQKKRTVFAFILPMLFYIGGAVAAFLMRDGDKILLAAVAAGGVLAVVSLILAIASRGGDDYDDYDDPFEDDFDE